ncbi:T9SS type A sorting domain-containing protein [Paraflavisolibacter sp. H34]|uniref:T9SS type A sorting domain-containing protein n=1 Tax=Huijunlia imazamoxiresistens TaxID=3127457 RepID=UPI003017F82B
MVNDGVNAQVQAPAQAQPASAPPSKVSLLRFFPNPAVSRITFSFQKDHETGHSIRIYNFLGKLMYKADDIGEQTIVDLGTFNKGLYIYQLFDKKKNLLESGKFQVSRY